MKKFRETVGGVLALVAFFGVYAVAGTLDWYSSLPACASEGVDTAQTCLWNAKTRGNGKGVSFVLYADGHTEDVPSFLEALI